MNKYQKLVQKQFLNDEEKVIKNLENIYLQSYKDIKKKISVLDSSIAQLQKAYNSITDDDIGDLAAAFLKGKNFTPDEAKETLQSMIQSKVYQKNYQQALKKQVSDIYTKVYMEEYKTVSDYLNDCYENGFIGAMYDLQGQGIPLCFPLDQEAMVTAVQLDSKISQGLYAKLGEDIDELKTKITAQISRGVATGMSYSQVAQQLAGVSNIGFNNAVRIARTEGHRIQVQSAMNACYNAKDMGADVVKQWDSTLDGRTRPSHQKVDGEIRELDEPFSNGLMFPGDPAGGAAEVVNCRCALLQRARWALDEEELQTLQDRAAFYGLDKTANFEEYKQKYLQAAAAQQTPPKKAYLTKKKLEQKIADIDDQLQNVTDPAEIQKLEAMKADYQEKLDKKLVAAETKKLKKAQIDLQDQLDNYDIKTYSNIWKDDVTTLDWQSKQGSIAAKRQYFEQKLLYATDPDEIKKWQGLLDDLDDFDKQGKAYYDLKKQLDKTDADLKNLLNGGKISSNGSDDAFSQERKNNAYWFTDQNGSVKAADGVLRDKAGEVWRSASKLEKDSIYDYTGSYHKYNEPLRGIEYGTNKYLGVGNVDLDMIGVNSYGGFKKGQIHKQIDAITSIIDKSSYDFDIWVQRGCGRSGMDKFFGISMSDFNLPEAELAAKLVGTTPTEYAFMSTGVAKGRGLNLNSGILMNIYAPKGTKAMYLEPISQFGHGDGRSWDGLSKQSYFGHEAEMLFQRGTKFRVTKVEKKGSMIYVDMEVIEQGVH